MPIQNFFFRENRNTIYSKILLLLVLLVPHFAGAARIYVDADAPLGGNGTSWQTAYRFLQDGLADTVSGRGDEVWIADGVYYPTRHSNYSRDTIQESARNLSFYIKNGVRLYGGFNGTETNRNERNWEKHISLLSGEITKDRLSWSCNVTTVENGGVVLFDGIEVSKGNSISDISGDCDSPFASAVLYTDDSTKITARNSTFSDHVFGWRGGISRGGVWYTENSVFKNNTHLGRDKTNTHSGSGALGSVSYKGQWTVVNSVFEDNLANQGGVAYGGTWTVTGSDFINNSSDQGGGVAYFGDWNVENCNFFGNSSKGNGGVASRGTWTVSKSDFNENVADHGGVASRSTWVVTQSRFIGNRAFYDIDEWNAQFGGLGILPPPLPRGGVSFRGDWVVVSSFFDGNSADYGGVAYGGTWEIVNGVLIGNSAPGGSGGAASSSTWNVVSSTFSGNTAKRGSVAANSEWNFVNSIIDSRNSSSDGFYFVGMESFENFLNDAGSPSSKNRAINLVEAGISKVKMEEYLGPISLVEKKPDLGDDNIITSDPQFTNPNDPKGVDNQWGTADDGLNLQPASPAVGEGDESRLPSDLSDLDGDGDRTEKLPYDVTGDFRVQNGNLDLGAYELTDNSHYEVKFLSAGNGAVEPSGDRLIAAGTEVSVSAAPNPGYVFEEWSGSVAGGDPSFILMVDGDKSVIANFEPDLRDPDNDGLTNYKEVVVHDSDPQKFDTSGDGLADGALAEVGLDPNKTFSELIGEGTLAVDLNQNGITDSFEKSPDATPLNGLGYYSETQLVDGRAGSTIISANDDGSFTLVLELMKSNDLQSWTVLETISKNVSFSGNRKFFRFRVKE